MSIWSRKILCTRLAISRTDAAEVSPGVLIRNTVLDLDAVFYTRRACSKQPRVGMKNRALVSNVASCPGKLGAAEREARSHAAAGSFKHLSIYRAPTDVPTRFQSFPEAAVLRLYDSATTASHSRRANPQGRLGVS
ncbi:hypothetical protein BDV96DRAFT_643035 [Lophiotrema nucula]|uniref:Uncharacterized protein n=1 Tax=Lophiotrema nucula TaxID=690887 RepID=A0A6A5ZHZ4_9PLEO|nr:hypothetical protein BDV96DRAFT_643035 [Lophiotrema nucula]